MRRILLILAGAAVILPHSCSLNEGRVPEWTPSSEQYMAAESVYEPDEMRVRLTPEMAGKLEDLADTAGRIFPSAVKSGECSTLQAAGVLWMERTFPYAGKFEPRTRMEGLHLWYDVRLDGLAALTRAGEELSGISGVEIVERRPRTVLTDTPAVFDDPYLPAEQWHYYNDGSYSPSVPGADINVVPVWEELTTGSSDVIVAVVDGGIDYAHEDLAGNMWHNPEQTGDEAYGYNFVSHSLKITPEDHGTHVAGTVGAVNNNGIGVCGVAGGDYARGIPGVRLMSCQIFEGNRSSSGAQAIKWAADHGAVIAQNSWGYENPAVTTLYTSDKEAIDYFVKYAGIDENGNQSGPMAGGVVIFAAGNSSLSYNYPSSYEACVSVAAVSSDYRAAYYTNYGDWVDVSAPGGDERKGALIYSTLPGNQYGGMQGTSMACPHVSGIAALAVSYLGGPGFTAEALKERLLNGVNDISSYNPGILIGKGLIDAYKVLVTETGEPPAGITDLKAEVESNRVTVTFTVPEDPDDDRAAMVLVYYGEESLDHVYTFKSQDLYCGTEFSGSFLLPDFGVTYRLAAAVTDAAGNRSQVSDEVAVTTGLNSAPLIEPLSDTDLTLAAHESRRLMFHVEDAEGHEMSAMAVGGNGGELPDGAVTMEWISCDTLAVDLAGPEFYPGNYTVILEVTDAFGMSSSVEIKLTVTENHAPEMIRELKGVSFGSPMSLPATLRWKDYIRDVDGEIPEISVDVEDWSVGAVSVNADGDIVVTPMSYGQTDALITAVDAMGGILRHGFRIVVRDGSSPVDLYPVPVVSVLRIRAGEDVSGDVRILSPSGAEVYRGDNVDISVFSPLEVDMSSLPGGIYTVEVRYGDVDMKRSIAKL